MTALQLCGIIKMSESGQGSCQVIIKEANEISPASIKNTNIGLMWTNPILYIIPVEMCARWLSYHCNDSSKCVPSFDNGQRWKTLLSFLNFQYFLKLCSHSQIFKKIYISQHYPLTLNITLLWKWHDDIIKLCPLCLLDCTSGAFSCTRVLRNVSALY